jgi:hypothetical protein
MKLLASCIILINKPRRIEYSNNFRAPLSNSINNAKEYQETLASN